MTLRLDDILNRAALADMIEQGYIRMRTHPLDEFLRIFNYTEKAQYEHVWTHETKTCRGLIIDGNDVVIARPWSKFFNYGQHAEGTLDLSAPVEVTDKMDGSLGILYEAPDGWAIATRGSFASEQAVHATQILRERYLPGRDWQIDYGFTYLFEIVYPANRIVLDYRELDDLVLLGAVWNYDGTAFGPGTCPEWPGLRTQTIEAATLAEALALPPRPNREGLVVRYLAGESNLLVKIKQEDYVALHRLVTGLSERTVWEHLSANGGTYTGLLEAIPDEFHGWVRDVATRLIAQHDETFSRADAAYGKALLTGFQAGGDRVDRKAFALAVREQAPDVAQYCFLMLDGRDPAAAIWKSIRPVGSNPMVHTSEDVA